MNIFESLKNFLENNFYLNITFLFLGIIGIIATLITFFAGKNFKRLYYNTKINNVIKKGISKIKSLKVLYEDIEVENLSISKFSIWNEGNEVINQEDIAPKDKLRISAMDSVKILDANIEYIQNSINNIEIFVDKPNNQINISFDFLQKYEGFIVQIIHTGQNQDSLKFEGTIKGVSIKIPKSFDNIAERPWIFMDRKFPIGKVPLPKIAKNFILGLPIALSILLIYPILIMIVVFRIFSNFRMPKKYKLID